MTAVSTFADDLARRTISTAFDSELFVQAGAGSGKTHALVSRVVGLITAGITSIDRVVVVTFTEAAAEELRDRIRIALRSTLKSHSDSEVCRRVALALDDFARARISTIHGFCLDLLKRAGEFDSSSVLLDPIEENRLLGNFALESLKERWLHPDAASTSQLTMLNVLAVRTKHWLSLIEQLHARWDMDVPRNYEPIGDLARSFQLVVEQAELLERKCEASINESDTLVSFVRDRIVAWIKSANSIDSENAATVDSNAAIVRLLADAPYTNRQLGNKKNWPIGSLEEARGALVDFGDACRQMSESVNGQVLRWMISHAGAVVAEFAEYRRSRHLFTFHDLLVRSNRILDNEAGLAELAADISHILVDEFQDTDQLQWSVISKLAGALRREGAAPLFAVGDVKQSIYRFRGADLPTYMEVRNEMRNQLITLDTSFRSTELLVKQTNRIGGSLFSGVDIEIGLKASRETASSSSYEVIDQEFDPDVLMDEIRQAESALVVRQIEELIKANGISYGDIAILIPTRVALPALEASLKDSRIPFRIESPVLMWNTQEIVDLINILRTCVDSSDEVALIGALRSPYFGCSDRQLLEFRQQGGTWNRRKIPGDIGANAVGKCLTRLNELAKRIQFLPSSVSLAAVVNEMNAFALANTSHDPESVRNRLEFLLHSARQYSEREGSSLAFCDWADAQRSDRALAYEYPLRASGSNAVRVMTIHAAKGLEFPAVIVCGLNSQSAPPPSVRVLWNNQHLELRIGSKTNGLQTKGFLECEELDKQAASEESARLLYVAITRARDHLAISTVRRKGSRCLAADWVDVFLAS